MTTFLFGLTYPPGGVWAGAAFSATLMTILVCHEMGHFVVARHHGVDASLPYFIPLPPMISLGTMGAIIRMRTPIEDRDKLLDVGAAGPIAGLVVAVPLLIVGLWFSPTSGVAEPGAVLEGNSIAYIALKYLAFGRYLPAADGTDVQLHPMAFAAWVGILITFINLLPIGQLDGGHVACAVLGSRHERTSGILHGALLGIAAIVGAALMIEARDAGLGWGRALSHASWGAVPWCLWALLLLIMRRMAGGDYHPPVGQAQLSPGRRRLALFMLLVFILIFTPVPMRALV